jgi:chitinase
MPAHWDTLATTLRSNFALDTSKKYYLTSAPQCPFPDASNPMAMLLQCDFVFVQFYNNAPCEVGSTGFNASLQQWSTALEASPLVPKPRLYMGAPAWSLAGPSAYARIGSPKGMQAIAAQTEALGLSNFGGVMFWDGSEGLMNVEDGKDIISWAKSGLVQG